MFQSSARTQRSIPLVVLVVLALLAAACGGDDDDSPAAGGDADSSGQEAEEELEAAQPDPDGILRWGINFENFLAQDQLTPVHSTNSCEFVMLDYVYSTLVEIDDQNRPVPGLAESWEIVDPATVEFTLRPGLQFSDGSPLTAESVVQTIQTIKEGFPAKNTITALNKITSVEALDERTVRFTTDGPWAQSVVYMMSDLGGMPLAPSVIDGTAELPIGAGPMRIESFTPGQELRLVRNDLFHGDWQLGGITFVNVGLGPASATALETGEVDLVSVDTQTSKQFTDDRYEVATTPPEITLSYNNIALKSNVPPLDDVRVRRAINHAINKEDILQAALGGDGALADQNFPEGSPWHVDAIDDPYPYDPDEARRLLDEAGVEEGTKLTVVFPGSASNVETTRQAQLVQENLQDVGFEVELVPAVDTPSILSEFFLNPDAHMFSAALPGNEDPVQHLDSKFGSSFVANNTGNNRPEVIALLEEANRNFADEEARDQALRDAVDFIVDEALEVPIAWSARNIVFDTERLGGTVAAPNDICGSLPLEDAYVIEQR